MTQIIDSRLTPGWSADMPPAYISSDLDRLFNVSLPKQMMLGLFNAAATFAPEFMTSLSYRLWTTPRRRRLKYKSNLPRGGHQIEIPYRRDRLRGFRWGTEGPKALLVHGWESHIGRMLNFVPPLRQIGCQVIAVDGPAHGLSGHRSTNIYDFGAGLARVIEAVDGVDVIVAHSYGATAALFMLAQEPRLLPKKIVCLAPMVHMRIHIGIFKTLAGLSDQMTNRLEEMIGERLGVNCADWHLLDQATQVRRPSLIIHDELDKIVPIQWGNLLASSWSDTTFVKTNGLGHTGILRDRETIMQTTKYIMSN